jgi:ABC-type multidrug transport system fused ATPase/permease subunit
MILSSLISMSFSTVSVFFIHPLFGTVFCLYMLVVVTPVLWRLKRIHSRSKDYANARASVTGRMVDSLGNYFYVKSFGNRDYEMRALNRAVEPEIRKGMKLARNLIQIELWRRLTIVIFGSTVTILTIYGWQAGMISVGDISAIMGMAVSVAGAIWMLGGGIVQTTDHLGYISDALRIMAKSHDVVDPTHPETLQILDGTIAFRDVCFSFDNNAVFDRLNLHIPADQRVGLLGASGAGKSTLVNLLLRFYDIDSGAITIDGQNIAEVRQDDLRQQISVIPQDTSLFHRSLMENIRYGRLDAGDEEVIEAAKKAYAHDFISELPDGYHTLVGDRGVKLSGGQRQRIAIARAILKDAPILVLDEATSALDSESEQAIQQSLVQAMEGKTVIAIAHRLSTIAHLDRLIVMDQGQIVEDGTHEDLLAKGGLYARLWRMQSGGFLQ